MKIIINIRYLIFCSITLLLVSGCEKLVTDYGNDAAISGKVVDSSGNIVAGDITSTNLSIKTLGEGDIVTTDMRVKGDGTYQNTKLFPKSYKIWITGPVTMTSDTLTVDFATESSKVYDFVVTPFLTVKPPVLVGSPTATEITVSYEITGNDGKTPNLRQLYCSTNPYPNASTGSGPFYETKMVTMTTNSGNATVTGLKSKTKYFIRVGARATGTTAYNFSDQIVVTTP